MPTREMLVYYERRQGEYEDIYAKPERQEDLARLEKTIAELVSGRRVLELACGTGYWTRRIARVARSVLATDASARLVERAVASCDAGDVQAGVVDAFAIPKSPSFDCVVAGFFFSHVPVRKQGAFVDGIARALDPGARLVLFDNRYIEGSSTPIARRSAEGDTFQTRRLGDGSTHEVLKNFPTTAALQTLLERSCRGVSVRESPYYWLASGVLGGALAPSAEGRKVAFPCYDRKQANTLTGR